MSSALDRVAAAAAQPASPDMDMTAACVATGNDDTQLANKQQQQMHWQQQVPASSSLLSRASKLGSDTYSAAKRFTGDHIHVPRIPYLSSSAGGTPSTSALPPSSASSESQATAGPSGLDREPSLKPYDHREKTALHALRDTFVLPTFPNPSHLLPSHIPLPSIPCMGGLGQSNLFADPPADAEADQLQAGPKALSPGKDPFKRLQGNVLMMGGYRGSILRDAATGRRLWVPLRVGFNVRKADLAIGLTAEDELRTRESVVPGKSLAAIAGFVDLGKRLKDRLKALHADGQLSFHGWGYDWRRSLYLSSAELVAYLEAVKAETGRGTTVLAHSMAGLVALHALASAKDPSIFEGIVFGSTPFNGTPNILQPFKHGDSILLNKEICSPSTVFSFRSSFYLLPPDGLCFYRDSDGSAMQMDFLDPQSWTKNGLSPMTAKLVQGSADERAEQREEAAEADGDAGPSMTVPQMGGASPHASTGKRRSSDSSDSSSAASLESFPEASAMPAKQPAQAASDQTILAYLERTLSEVARFRGELSSLYDAAKAAQYPPLVILSSRKTPTVKGCVVDGEQDIIEGKYNRLLFGEGDGIILHKSAQAIPQVWKSHIVANLESSNGHVSILSDLPIIGKALEALEQANAARKM